MRGKKEEEEKKKTQERMIEEEQRKKERKNEERRKKKKEKERTKIEPRELSPNERIWIPRDHHRQHPPHQSLFSLLIASKQLSINSWHEISNGCIVINIHITHL